MSTSPTRSRVGTGPKVGFAAATPALVADPGVRFAVSCVALVVATAISALAGASLTASTTATTLVAAVAALGLRLPWRLLVGLVGWALVTGFCVNQYGELTFRDDDLLRLALHLIAAPALSTLVLTPAAVSRRTRRS